MGDWYFVYTANRQEIGQYAPRALAGDLGQLSIVRLCLERFAERRRGGQVIKAGIPHQLFIRGQDFLRHCK